MLSYWKRTSPIRNTVLTIGIAVLLRAGWHLVFGSSGSDFLSVKGLFACLVIGWALVDFWDPEWWSKPKLNGREEIPKEQQETQR